MERSIVMKAEVASKMLFLTYDDGTDKNESSSSVPRSVQKRSNFCEKRVPKRNVHPSTLSEERSLERKGQVFLHFPHFT